MVDGVCENDECGSKSKTECTYPCTFYRNNVLFYLFNLILI
jgi:hypothetical protein